MKNNTMKYRFFITVFVLMLTNNLIAQNFNNSRCFNINKYTVLDSAELKVSYELNYRPDSTKEKIILKDLQVLLIGKDISKYYSQLSIDYSKYIDEYMKRNKGAEGVPGKDNAGWSFEVFRNHSLNKITVVDAGSMLMEDYLYEEEIPKFEWKISVETETVLSYKCQKATTSFRGRDYVAWFTSEIPIPLGPWKFAGLPGLILKLYDTKEDFVFECNGLEQLKEKEPIKFYQLEYSKVKRKDLNKMYQRFHDDVIAYLKSYFESMGRKIKTTGGNSDSIMALPYNPIELE